MRLGTLVHNTTLMSKSHLQVCKQQTASSNTSNLVRLAFLTMTLVHNTTPMSKPYLQVYNLCRVPDYETWYTGTQYHSNVSYKFVNNNKQPKLACVSFSGSKTWCTGTPHCSYRYQRTASGRPPQCFNRCFINPLCIGGT